MYLCSGKATKTEVEGVAQDNPKFIDFAGVMRFQVEAADLVFTEVTKEEEKDEKMKEIKDIKTLAAKQLRDKSRGQFIEYGAPFILRNVQYGLYLMLNQDRGGKGAMDLSLSSKLTQDCLFRAKGSVKITGLGLHMKYDVPSLLMSASFKELNATLAPHWTDEGNWTVKAKQETTPWWFTKFEDANVPDNYVRFMTPIRLRLKGSNYFISAKSLQVSSKDKPKMSPEEEEQASETEGDTHLVLTHDADNIATHFFLVGTENNGGCVGWEKPFYLVQAVNLCYLDETLGLSLKHNPRFTCRIKGSKSSSQFVPFNLGVSLILGNKEMALGIDRNLSTDEAAALAATFDSSYQQPGSQGHVKLKKSGSLFEIEPVIYEDTLQYQGLPNLLANMAKFTEVADQFTEEALAQFDEDTGYTKEVESLVESLGSKVTKLMSPLKNLAAELKEASVMELITQQKVLIQVGIPYQLTKGVVTLARIMKDYWKRNNLIKDEEEEHGSDYYSDSEDYEDSEEASGSEPAESGTEGSAEVEENAEGEEGEAGIEEEQGEAGEEEKAEGEEGEAVEAGQEVVGEQGATEGQEEASGEEGEEGEQGEVLPESGEATPKSEPQKADSEPDDEKLARAERIRETLQDLAKESHGLFRLSFEFLFDCVKSSPSNCKVLLPLAVYLLNIFELGRELLGRILAEIYTYSFPEMTSPEAYYHFLAEYFRNITQANITQQHYFTKMFRFLITSDTRDSQLFSKFVFDKYANNDYWMSIRFLKRDAHFFIQFEMEEVDAFELANPCLKGLEKVVEDTDVYYPLEKITDANYVEYIKQCMMFYCSFDEPNIAEKLSVWNGVTSKMMLEMVSLAEVSISIRQAALYTLDRFITSTFQKQESLSGVVNIEELPQPPKSFNLSDDLVLPPAGEDVRQTVKLILTLTNDTVSYFAESVPVVEKAKFITGLLKLGLSLINLDCIAEPLVYELLSIAKIGLQQVAEKSYIELKQNWFTSAVKETLKLAQKKFEAKVAIEEMYSILLSIIHSSITLTIKRNMWKLPQILKEQYSQVLVGSQFQKDVVLKEIQEQIVAPTQALLHSSALFQEYIQAHSTPTVEPSSSAPLLTSEVATLNPLESYGLTSCTMHSPEALEDVIYTLFYDAMPLGIKFDQILISELIFALSINKTVLHEIKKLVIYDNRSRDILNLIQRCDITEMKNLAASIVFGESEELMEGVKNVTGLLCRHPFLSEAKSLRSEDTLANLQSVMSRDEEDLKFVMFFLRRVNEMTKSGFVDECISTARAACLRFLTSFISGNISNKQAVVELLRPDYVSFLLPEGSEFLKELFDYDYLSAKDTERVFEAMLKLFKDPGPNSYFALDFLQSIVNDRSGRFKPFAQNIIIEEMGSELETYINQLENDEELEPTDLRYVELSLKLLSDCAVGNLSVREQVKNLITLDELPAIFERQRNNYGLLSSFLQIIKVVFLDQDIDTQSVLDVLKTTNDIVSEILEHEEELLDVIRLNVFEAIPSNSVVQLSPRLSILSPEQFSSLQKLTFLLSGNAKKIQSGVIVCAPSILIHLMQHDDVAPELVEKHMKVFTQMEGLCDKLDDVEYTWDLEFCRSKLRQAKRKLTESTDAMIKKSMQGMLKKGVTTAEEKPSFHHALSELYHGMKEQTSTDTTIVTTLSAKLKVLYDAGKTESVCISLKELMRRLPIFPLSHYFRLLADFSESLTDEQRIQLLQSFLKTDIITETFYRLFEMGSIKGSTAILEFLNAILSDQPPPVLVQIKNILAEKLLDTELFELIRIELRDSLTIQSFAKDSNLPKSSYMPFLSRLNYKTYADEGRRNGLIQSHRHLITSLLLLLQRFCDNCNLPLQDYMRDQGDTQGLNTNFPKIVTDYLCSLCGLIPASVTESDLLECVDASIHTLIEFATGPCPSNQELIGTSVPVFLALNKVLERPADSYYAVEVGIEAKPVEDKYTEIRAAAIKLLLVLMEGDPSPQVVTCLDKYLKKSNLLDNLVRVYQTYISKYRSQIETEDPLVKNIYPLVENALDEACFLLTLLNKNGDQSLDTILRTDQDREAFHSFYLSYIGYVEIAKAPESPNPPPGAGIRQLYFVVPFKAKFLPYESAVALVVSADHTSHQDIVEGLLRSTPSCKLEMEHHQQIARTPVNEFLISKWRTLKLASLALVFITNFSLVLLSDPAEFERMNWGSWLSFLVVFVLGLLQIALYVAGTTLYVIDTFPKLVTDDGENEGMDMEDLAKVWERDCLEPKFKEELVTGAKEVKEPTPVWRSVLAGTLGSVVYVLVSLFAISFPLLYPLLLFQVFEHVPELSTVLQAITYNRTQLIYTGLFGAILIFILSTFAFVYDASYFSAENNMQCNSLFECFTSVLNMGLRSGGGLGDVLGQAQPDQFWGRLVFDLLFFLIITVIMLNIIFGIIIDTFGELRDKRNALIEDINSKCYICGTDRSLIELYGKGWSYHFKNEHSPYAYLAFLVYLIDTPTADCSGVEKYAKEKYLKMDTTFLPATSKILALRTN